MLRRTAGHALDLLDVQRQGGADEPRERRDLLAHGVAPRGGRHGGGEAVVARALVRQRGAEPRRGPGRVGRAPLERVAELGEADVEQLGAVVHARRRGRGEVACQRARRRDPGHRELDGRRERVPGRPRLSRRERGLARSRVRCRPADQRDVHAGRRCRRRRGGDP